MMGPLLVCGPLRLPALGDAPRRRRWPGAGRRAQPAFKLHAVRCKADILVESERRHVPSTATRPDSMGALALGVRYHILHQAASDALAAVRGSHPQVADLGKHLIVSVDVHNRNPDVRDGIARFVFAHFTKCALVVKARRESPQETLQADRSPATGGGIADTGRDDPLPFRIRSSPRSAPPGGVSHPAPSPPDDKAPPTLLAG